MKSRFRFRGACALLFVLPLCALAQDSAKARIDALRAELEAMHKTDQAHRLQTTKVENEHGRNSSEMAALWATQMTSDQHNIKRLEEIIAEIGWPKRSAVGELAAQAAFLILQHSDIVYQKKYLSLAREAVAAGEMRASSLALLEDRVLLREGKQQIYGSQVTRNAVGQWEARDLADPDNVDKRRASVGLPPLAEYLERFAQRSGGTVADKKATQPGPDAPPLTQALFAATDDDRAAHAKLTATKPEGGEAGVQFQFACRDFCARFPDSPLYPVVRLLAVNRVAWLRGTELERLGDWRPGEAEHDPKLTRVQRATAAVERGVQDADRRNWTTRADWAPERFQAAVAVARKYADVPAVRDRLLGLALDVSPQVALPVLRELYPDDAIVAAGIKVVEAIGRPGEFQLTGINGEKMGAADFRGKVTALVFGSTSASFLGNTVAKLRDWVESESAQNFAVAWVSFDRERSDAESFAQSHPFLTAVHWDGLGWISPLAQQYRINRSPYYLLLDRQGVLRFRGLSPSGAIAEERIKTLLAEPRAN